MADDYFPIYLFQSLSFTKLKLTLIEFDFLNMYDLKLIPLKQKKTKSFLNERFCFPYLFITLKISFCIKKNRYDVN